LQAKEDLVEKYKAKPPTTQKNPTYAAMIESMDDCVGKVLDVLDELKLADDTVVILTGDNGGLLGSTDNAPLRSGKGYPYEGGIREPLMVRWPRVVRPGTVSREPVTSVDFLPTLCEIAGVALPADRPIDGVSLASHLRSNGRQGLGRRAIYWHFPHYRGDVVPYSIIRAGDWKLIKRYEGKEFELYNLRQDMSEMTDLSRTMPEKVRELDVELQAALAAMNAKMPRPNPMFDV